MDSLRNFTLRIKDYTTYKPNDQPNTVQQPGIAIENNK